jgi:hypothetical protein
MAFLLKENEKDARERLKAFWEGSSLGRPTLYITAKNPNYEEIPWTGPELDRKDKDINPEWQAWYNNNLLDSCIYLAEAMPAAFINYGSYTTISTLVGGEYEYYGDSAWIKQIDDIWRKPLPVFDKEHHFIKTMERCLIKVAQIIGNKGFLNPTDLLDGLTTLSSFRTQEKLCFDLIENPEMVINWCNALTDMHIKCYEHFYQFLNKLGYKDTCTWLKVMTEGRFEAVHCDFGVLLSPGMYEKFALPDLRRRTDYLDYSIYHLDGTCQMRFLKLLKTLPKLKAIQWSPEIKTVHPMTWIKDLKEIRNNKLSLYILCNNVEEAIYLTKELGPDGLMMVLPKFNSVVEAEIAIKKIENAC